MATPPSQQRARFRGIANAKRAIPHQFGLREFTVDVVRVARGEYQRGPSVATKTRITNGGGSNPKVRELSGEERALGGYESGTIEVGPITPEYTVGGVTGGTPLETLDPELEDGEQLYYLITGPGQPTGGGRYVFDGVKTDKALHFLVTLRRVADGLDNTQGLDD